MSEKYKDLVDNKYIAKVKLGEDYKANIDIMTYTFDDPLSFGKADITATSVASAAPKYMMKAKYRDTTVGGNEAINCYYQFNENDDIIHKINEISADPPMGLGRVYNETFDEQQQILYLTFGTPSYTNVATFLQNLYDTNLADMMNNGDVGVLSKLGKLAGNILGTAVKLPFMPIIFLSKLAEHTINVGYKPTKYYELKPTMPLYYRMVNTILTHLAVNMGLTATDEVLTNKDVLPMIFREHGLNILSILNRKHWYDSRFGVGTISTDLESAAYSTDELLDRLHKAGKDNTIEEQNWGIGTGFGLATSQALDYVGFRVEKNVDNSESISSSTKESEISRFVNGQVSAGRDRTFNLSTLRESKAGALAEALYQGVSGVVTGALESFNLHGGAEILKGSGYIDIPEVWENSSFSKSYSFDFQLRTPYGDKLSIFYSLYIPLAMLIAGAFPRSTGANSYTSPFLVRAYCQGMFAIPLGIIDSITIRRGAPEYGWSVDLLPTQIDVSVSIKDLSTIMHVMIGDNTQWLEILGNNSAFQEYMLTLSGANIAERLLLFKGDVFKKRMKIISQMAAENTFNPMMIGYRLGNTRLGRIITALRPSSRLPSSANLGG